MTTRVWHPPLAWAALWLLGCTGSVSGGGENSAAGSGNVGSVGTDAGSTAGTDAASTTGTGPSSTAGTDASGTTGGTTQGTTGGVVPTQPVNPDDLADLDPEELEDAVPAATRVVRLGYEEYDRTISDLLYLDVSRSGVFPLELPTLAPYEGAQPRAVNERLLGEFGEAAVALAEQVVTTPTAYSQVVPCTPGPVECRDQFIDSFGLRAYRRPLSDAERGRLRTLFDSAAGLIQSGDAFRDGVQLVLEAVLQSAKFLYRAELGTGAVDSAGVPLTDYELASRLSYMFWGTMPDAELFEAAALGMLSTPAGLEQQARRLVNSPRAVARVRDFHARWIQLDDLSLIEKSVQSFPKFTEALVASMREETLRFVESVTLTDNGAVLELLKAPFSFVNAELADLYGVSGNFGSDFTRVDFAPDSGRMGLLTQAAFLNGHSSNSTGTSPILRGVFVLKRLACEDIPAPPPGAELLEPDGARPELTTTREFFAWKTSMPTCAACHSLVNPTGFAFEQFDGIGQFRDTENGAPVDSSGVLNIAGETIPFGNAAELISGLAGLGRVRSCYAQNWLTYLYGRPDTTADGRILARITQDMATGTYGVRDLMVSMTQGAAFRYLPPIAE